MRGALKAWGWYVAGASSVLLALWLYTRRYSFEISAPADELEHDGS